MGTPLLDYGFPNQKDSYMRIKLKNSYNMCICKTKINIREDSLAIPQHINTFHFPKTFPLLLLVEQERKRQFASLPFPFTCKRVLWFKAFQHSITKHNKAYTRIRHHCITNGKKELDQLPFLSLSLQIGLNRKIDGRQELIHLPPPLLSLLHSKRLLLFGYPSFLLQLS